MIISHKHKFVCLNPPKTGSGFRENLFREYIDDGFLPGKEPPMNLRHYTSAQAESHLLDKNLNPDSYFWFTFTRSPWPRIVSWYNMVINQNCGEQPCIDKYLDSLCFEKFVTKIANNYKTQDMYYLRSGSPVDYIGSLESIGQDLIYLSSHLNLNIPTYNYKSHEISYHKDISKLWTEKTINIIKDVEAAVIGLKNYSFKHN